uniref:ATP synthase complex subunit 8 n=1 Tax=Bathyanthias cubensis TaxID=2996725 RepID=A0AA51X1L3_9TELE|nr:ATP synthase F0 subunit 8 [Bathyanthias cubensis]WMY90218.1 ATP synthase F0 subunit 8 [Bathyanthias cubensis]WMY90231.1 ATP synthase F0 subunit 8 [Bathyanthias cubensis]WMY90244.1 ATP synthase F0 subunit 8 [Bathyanthias cubensis]WMY90257.1 ATP synthase F0 subunit 8 [Bathyanthias cubensis]
MPQLNPLPWFGILTFSWLIFLLVIFPTVLSNINPNQVTASNNKARKSGVWSWPWQ